MPLGRGVLAGYFTFLLPLEPKAAARARPPACKPGSVAHLTRGDALTVGAQLLRQVKPAAEEEDESYSKNAVSHSLETTEATQKPKP